MHIHIGHLYPSTMSTYGDAGNITCLRQRAAWRGIETTVHNLEVGVDIPKTMDLYFFGGGQDAAQGWLADDLQRSKGPRLKDDVTGGTPLLSICGGYQLLGRSYIPFAGQPIPGVGLFPVETRASKTRMIGDLVIRADTRLSLSPEHPTIVGFENHSGKTSFLNKDVVPLGTVFHGHGNNGEDSTEGCVMGSAIGCYLHGSLLPKNPHLADWLLEKACRLHASDFALDSLDDRCEWSAHDYIAGRYLKR